MPPQGNNSEPLTQELWSRLEELYESRTQPAGELAVQVGMTGPSLGRAIHEGRDAHLSTIIKVANALGFGINIELVPLKLGETVNNVTITNPSDDNLVH